MKPMKMELIEVSETSAIRTQTPGYYPKENILLLSVSRTLNICKFHGICAGTNILK